MKNYCFFKDGFFVPPKWEPVTGPITIRGIQDDPQSAREDWSIDRVVNAATDVIRFEVHGGDKWALDSGPVERSELDGYRQKFENADVWGHSRF